MGTNHVRHNNTTHEQSSPPAPDSMSSMVAKIKTRMNKLRNGGRAERDTLHFTVSTQQYNPCLEFYGCTQRLLNKGLTHQSDATSADASQGLAT